MEGGALVEILGIRFCLRKCEYKSLCGKTVTIAWSSRVFLYGEDCHTHRFRAKLWALRKGIETHWGIHPSLFLRLVHGVIIPSLFYGAPCHRRGPRRLDSVVHLQLSSWSLFSGDSSGCFDRSSVPAGFLPQTDTDKQ